MLINCVIDGETMQLEDSILTRKEGIEETEDYRTEWIEYWKEGVDVPVHRSAHVTVKRFPQGWIEGMAAGLGS